MKHGLSITILLLLAFAISGCADQTPLAQPGINRILEVPINIRNNEQPVYVVIIPNIDVLKEGIAEDVQALQEMNQDAKPTIEISPVVELDGMNLP